MALNNFSDVMNLLNSISHVDNDAYNQIIMLLPPGIAARLRLVPDNNLSSKLAHLLCVTSFIENVPKMGFEYNTISVEGISDEIFLFDHDVILRDIDSGILYVIDCTSDQRLLASKTTKLVNILNEAKIAATPLIHIFKPKIFTIDISIPNELNDTNKDVFSLLDKLSLMKPEMRDRFYDCCVSVYNGVISSSMQLERPELKTRYEAWTSDSAIINLAKKLAQSHSLSDAVDFEIIADNTPASLYYETFEKILSQQRPCKEPFLVGAAAMNTNKEVTKVLSDLSGNPICNAIHAALTTVNLWCGVTEDNEVHHDIPFLQSSCKNGILPADSPYVVVAKNHKQHTYWIYFKETIIDQNFKEQICFAERIKENTNFFSTEVNKSYAELCDKYENYYSAFTAPADISLKNSIIGKIVCLSDVYMHDHDDVTGTASSMLYYAAQKINSTMVGSFINHQYEVVKSFSASLKVSARTNLYYVGINGPFSSVSIIRMCSTLDSFSTGSYFCIYKSASDDIPSCIKPIYFMKDKIVQTKTRTLNRNSIAHYLKLPVSLLSLITWEIEHVQENERTFDGKLFNKILVNSVLHLGVNSDQFAQAAEQIRYLFTSNIGLGADPLAICSKIDFIRTSTAWELLYIFRMLKLACSLNVIYKNKRIGDIMVQNEFGVMFPNSVKLATSFSHLISSMYYANLYNKFRAFHEVSEAICYNGLDDEDDIYKIALATNFEFVKGIKVSSIGKILDLSFISSDEIITDEIEFCNNMIYSGPGRFKFSLMFVIGATVQNVNISSIDYTVLYQKIGQSPIEACTMRGGMERGISSSKPQGIRAASVMLEELIEQAGSDPKRINSSKVHSAIFIDDLERKDFDFSILSCVLRQFKFNGAYRYRVVQKDQKGHREISVLNAKFRLGALFSEKIAHELSSLVRSDVLDDKNKDSILETSIRKVLRDKEATLAISDNSDQKRWGPNHLLHSFSAMYFALLKNDMGLFRTINLVMEYAENKYAKYPEKLLKMLMENDMKSKSEPIHAFIVKHKDNIKSDIFEKRFEWGMCQGIFHRTSSLYHGIMCYTVEAVLLNNAEIPTFELNSYVTSDDAERLLTFRGELSDRVKTCRIVHSAIANVGSVMNILRNESKSVFSAHITEFNSIFYHKGFLATPTLKQRISKLDIGDGHDHINDYLTALSMPMGYMLNGGSYSGTVIMTILNLVLHTEQWRRWTIIENREHIRPVEFGGFPAIEPFGTMISGPIINFFMRALPFCDIASYTEFLSETSMTPAMEVNLKDFNRTQFSAMIENDIFVLKTANPIGIISLARTDKRLSQFERRHHMTEWMLRDSSITLIPTESSAKKFIFCMSKITKTCKFESNSGTNTFFIRFADPWVNADRECLRYNPHSAYVTDFLKVFGAKTVSHNEFIHKALSASNMDIRRFFLIYKQRGISRDRPTAMVSKINSLLTDALAIRDSLVQTPEIKLHKVANKNTIVRVNLSSSYSVDSDQFYYTLLKNIVGKKIERALIERTRDADIWNNLEIMNLESKDNAIEGIYFCDNVIMAHNKYLRVSTKLICPGELKPANITDLLDTYLSSKFTEQFGTSHNKFPNLLASSFSMVAFKDCNSELIERSKGYLRNKESNININRTNLPSKIGIKCDSIIITEYDSFEIDESASDKKLVQISSKGRYGFMQRCKMWIGARVDIILSSSAMRSLLKSEFTYFHEYAIDDKLFVKNQTKLNLDVVVNNETCFEIQEAVVEGLSTFYRHHYFVKTKTFYINASSKIMDPKSVKPWAAKVNDFINDVKRFRTDIEHFIPSDDGRVTDSVFFHCIRDDDVFELIDYPNNLTIFLKHQSSKVIIPVCSINSNDTRDMNLGFNYNYSAFEEGLKNFQYFYEFITFKDSIPNKVQNFLRLLLFRSSAYTPVEVFNKLAEKNLLPVRVSSLESVDFLRLFLMCNLIKDMRSNRTRMQHYFLNLFRSSPFYNNGITSIRFNEKLFKDEDIAADAMVTEESDPIELTIPDIPLWLAKDREYNDLLSQPIVEEVIEDNIPVKAINETIYDVFAEFYDEEGDFDEGPLTIETPIMGKPESIDELFKEYNASLFGSRVPTITEPKIVAGIETVDIAVISRIFEDCPLMIRNLKDKAASYRIKTDRHGLFGNHSTFYGSIQIYCNRVIENLENAKTVFDRSFTQNAAMFKSKIPLSAICLAEMNY